MDEMMHTGTKVEKLQVALYTRGQGLILFAVWSSLRIFLTILSGVDDKLQQISGMGMALFFILCMAVSITDAVLRIYAGRSIISFSKGGELRRFTLPLTWCFIISSALVWIFFLPISSVTRPNMNLSEWGSMVLDAFVFFLNVEILIFMRRLKKARA